MQRWQGRFLSHWGHGEQGREGEGATDFSFRGVAVEAGLGGAVASALAVVGVYGKVEIHEVALGRQVRGHGCRERGRKYFVEGGLETDDGETGTLSTLVKGDQRQIAWASSRKRSVGGDIKTARE